VPSGAVDGNYTISYQNGNLSIAPAALTVTANNQTISYGTNVPATTTVSYSGLVNGDTASSLTTAPTVTSAHSGLLSAATYNGNYAVSGAVDPNYNMTYVAGNLIVNPGALALSITASDATKTAGTALVFAGTEFTSLGLVGTDTVGSVMLTSIGAPSTASAGSYAIIPSAATGGTFNINNYTITYVNGTLTVNAAPVTSLPNSVLLVAQNIPVYTPPLISDSIVATSGVSQQPAEQSQQTTAQGSDSSASLQMKSVVQGAYMASSAPVFIMGGLLQLDPKTIKEFGLEYLKK
jgi:hypothetical protein